MGEGRERRLSPWQLTKGGRAASPSWLETWHELQAPGASGEAVKADRRTPACCDSPSHIDEGNEELLREQRVIPASVPPGRSQSTDMAGHRWQVVTTGCEALVGRIEHRTQVDQSLGRVVPRLCRSLSTRSPGT